MTKNNRVVVRPLELLTVFTTHEETDSTTDLSPIPVHELLKVPVIQAAARWKMLGSVRQGQKTRAFVQSCLVHYPQRPIPSSIHPAALTLTTRELDIPDDVVASAFHKTDTAARQLERCYRAKAAHESQPPTAAHRAHLHIGSLGVAHIAPELLGRTVFVDWVTSHDVLLLRWGG